MHQVKLKRIPLFRTATGCRCRKTLDMMAMTRVRRSRGTPWRKIEFQTCELRMYSRGDIADCGLWISDCGMQVPRRWGDDRRLRWRHPRPVYESLWYSGCC